MNISGLIAELEKMRSMHGDLTVIKKRNGEEITNVYVYGANKCLLFSDLDELMDDMVRYVSNHSDLEVICNYILNYNLTDDLNVIIRNANDVRISLEKIKLDGVKYPYLYLHLEVYNDSYKKLLSTVKKIHGDNDYLLSINYYSTTDYDIKTYELPVKPDINELLK